MNFICSNKEGKGGARDLGGGTSAIGISLVLLGWTDGAAVCEFPSLCGREPREWVLDANMIFHALTPFLLDSTPELRNYIGRFTSLLCLEKFLLT